MSGEGGPSEREAKWKRGGTDPGSHDVGGGSRVGSGGPGPADHRAKGAASFDINSACTGFLAALNTAQTYIEAGIYKTVLVVGAEKLSSLVDWNDRNSCILFGDGAGAVVLKADPEGLYVQVSHSEGEKGQALTAPKTASFKWTAGRCLSLRFPGCPR